MFLLRRRTISSRVIHNRGKGKVMRFRNCECETCEFQKEQELDALEADAEQLALVNKDAQDGIDDYLKWAGLK